MPRRLSFSARFTLRTLFLAVSCLCIALAWLSNQLRWIERRREALDDPFNEAIDCPMTLESDGEHWMVGNEEPRDAPWSIRFLGEDGVRTILVQDEPERLRLTDGPLDQHERQRMLEALFPEAEVIIDTITP